MTWFDVKLSTLQHMFSVKGSDITEDNNTRTYLAGMPAVANEALRLILSVKASAWTGEDDSFAFTIDTPDDTVIPLVEECAVIMPLYIASQLYKEDDRGLATMWRNEFEVALEAASRSHRNVATVEVWGG